jgi:hypothetical protein
MPHILWPGIAPLLGLATTAQTGLGAPAVAQTFNEHRLPTRRYDVQVAFGSDSNIWFNEAANTKVATITTSGRITEYSAVSFSSSGPVEQSPRNPPRSRSSLLTTPANSGKTLSPDN